MRTDSTVKCWDVVDDPAPADDPVLDDEPVLEDEPVLGELVVPEAVVPAPVDAAPELLESRRPMI
jgi:hypothetical protein